MKDDFLFPSSEWITLSPRVGDWDSKWDQRFMDMARLVSSYSKDPSTKVGAVIVNAQKVVVGMGYNGFPRGVVDTDERYANRELKYKLVAHAEVNAVLNATASVKGCAIYVYPSMMVPNICPECAKVIVQAGVIEVVGIEGAQTEPRWQQYAEASTILLNEGGVRYRTMSYDPNQFGRY
jgi:dCMP deaminase